MTLKELIKHLRTKENMSQSEFAQRLGVSQVRVSNWESGTRLPTVKQMKVLHEFTGASIEVLFRAYLKEVE